MWEILRRAGALPGYFGHMRHNPIHKVEPVRRPEGLDRWSGLWVAIKNGEVIAVADSSLALVPKVREMGPKGAGAVAQFVAPRSLDIVIGVG